jgi:agmatine/peptidylarginine deiminase
LDLLRRIGEQRPALAKDKPFNLYPRVSGEFEPQKAMLLSISDLMVQHHSVLKELITKTAGRLPLIILVNDKKQLKTAIEIAESTKANLSHVKFFIFKLDTIWLRDFGPRFVETEGGAQSIDFYYDGTRPKDDQFPNKWGEIIGVKNKTVEWTLQGGNLISNGKGLAITSTRFFEDNYVRFPTANKPRNIEYERRKLVVDAFKTECNIDRLLFLRPLTPEATKHVDMFAKFLAPDHMLVARVDPRVDPVNAQILEENASFLRTIQVDGKPMRVDRIDMPPRQGKFWSPYTNTIFAKNLVLVPVYKSDSPQLVRNALQTYRRLLPGKHVDTIDLTSMQKLEGALHCMSINVPEYVDLPKGLLTAAQARQVVDGTLAWQPPKRLLVNKDVREDRDRHLKQGRRPRRQASQSVGQQPVMITGQVVAGDGSESSASQASDPGLQSQFAAAKTYRRVFADNSKSFSIDAYAVAISSGQVYLLRAVDKKTFKIDINRLSNEDRTWVQQNVTSIRANGALVKKFIAAYGSN